MRNVRYTSSVRRPVRPRRRKSRIIAIVLILAAGIIAYKLFMPTSVERAVNRLEFDASVAESEKQVIRDAITDQEQTYSGSTTVSVEMSFASGAPDSNHFLEAYVPVTHVYSSRQSVGSADLKAEKLFVLEGTDEFIKTALAGFIGVEANSLTTIQDLADIKDGQIALIPANQLSDKVKLLRMDETRYYLDSFNTGAIIRYALFTGDAETALTDLRLNNLPSKESVLKVNQSGVTALTRLMMRKLSSVKDPLYFSAKIGDFLADADITHVSNEVSFREGCTYSNTSFCSPMEFIETLKDSGVDLVEITGNHNNDHGNSYNTQTINLYHSLGWGTFGGGLNSEEARKPYIADIKGSKIAFLGYNMADGAGSGAIAGATTAGANIYTEEKARADIAAAKQNAQFVIVDIQYAECQAYPSGYVEYPICDAPIYGQQEDFRAMIDLGADMVIGSSAHQPQTYEIYKGKAIYYGLGNQYFEQTQWPGTERGIVLTHYFSSGQLLQTKLSPTVYDTALQTELMNNADAEWLLDRLNDAR